MKKWFCTIVLASAMCAQPVSACTIFTVKKNNTVLIAGNQDQAPAKEYLIVDHTGKYGVVFIATPSDANPMTEEMGVNEQGLSYAINAISSEKLVHVPNAIRQDEWALVKLMRETGSVNELLARFFQYDWGPSFAYQIQVADRSGDAAVIHPGLDGRLTFTRVDRSRNYLVSTNFNVRDAATRGLISPRYQTASGRLKDLMAQNTVSQKSVAAVLEATRQDWGFVSPVRTLYSTVVDLNTLDIDIYLDGRFDKAYRLNVHTLLAGMSGKTVLPLRQAIGGQRAN
ncbi:hypothetical protein [Asticcacaulis solisilvae]|uniref:hypothetical protein n=1 Tax=Asticcacaulis solisilvae TaxID=1217274 RepID=UPI003FD72EAF